MKNKLLLTLSLGTMVVLGVGLSSCKDDDEPFVKPKLSFSEDNITVNEADGTIEIEVKLDKPYSEDIVIDYSLDGTAIDKVSAGTSSPYDYEVLSEAGEIEIKKGETSGKIEIQLYSDSDIEENETIEISIEDVSNENIEVTRDDEIKITVEQEDGLIIALEWGVGEGENYTDVDMDLFLWATNENSQLVPTNYLGYSGNFVTNLRTSYTSPEFIFLPTVAFNDGTYGISCNYYEGSEDPMNFKVTFIELVNGAEAASVERAAFYTESNINPWDDETNGMDLVLAATFKKSGTDFTDFSDISTIGPGSRVGGGKIPNGLKRQPFDPSSENFNTILKRLQ